MSLLEWKIWNFKGNKNVKKLEKENLNESLNEYETQNILTINILSVFHLIKIFYIT